VTYEGKGRPDILIGVILAFQGPFYDHGLQDSQALKLVLDERGWRAGDHRVGFQACDETTATSEVSDPATCRRHARAFARNDTIPVAFGPVLSGCASEMLPIMNRARGGPLALVSPSNTYLGLTRSGPGVGEGEPERNFPTGRRSYVRLAAADDAQAAAAMLFAKRTGAERVFLLHDGDAFGIGLVEAFREGATSEGLTITGRAAWDGKARGYASLVQRIARTRPDAVYLGGYISSNGVRLVKDLRAALGQEVRIIAPDGFNQPGNLVEGAGEGAEGMAITIAVLPTEELPPEGRDFATEFERQYSARPCCFAVHAGQAAHMILDAIEASDGSREQVLAELLDSKVENGLLGDFDIDRYGDTTLTTIGVYRIEDGKLRFETGISPPRELLLRR
jgi:branched-chain amino acid transport system substrate-binding protein